MGRFCLECKDRETCKFPHGCKALRSDLAHTYRAHNSVAMVRRQSRRHIAQEHKPRIVCVGGLENIVDLEERGKVVKKL